jgi:non-specific serine/threonine protein kinase
MADGAAGTFGALVRRYRQRAALSQEALAERAGLSVDAVSVIERRTRGVPRPDTVALLARALELGPEERAAFAAAAHPHSVPAAAAPAASPASDAAPPALPVLPVALTSFIGREREMAAVCTRLREPGTRLLTLTGAGGVGKTRLALAVAARLLEEEPEAVRLVELASLADPALVPGAVAQALGLREEVARPILDTLTDALRGRHLLLVLDNCERLAAACAALTGILLRACPELRILATSRAALGLSGERRYRVPPLSAPEPHRLPPLELVGSYEAVRLFVARAQERQDDFALTEGNARAVAQVCARLDGIPLAIELAAARVGVLPVQEILTRLDARFRLLTGGPRDAPSRQRTLRATLDWSWELLGAGERALLRRLAAFAGACTLAAAEAVCAGDGVEPGEVLDVLDSLVNQSLVQSDARGEEARYRLLETVRQYAEERLAEAGEEPAVRDRHLIWCVGLAEEAEPHLTGPKQGDWLTQLEREYDNLRAALGWACESGASELGLQLAVVLGRFWHMRGYFGEGRGWLQEVLTRARAASALPGVLLVKGINAAGALAHRLGEYQSATVLFEESLARCEAADDLEGRAAALRGLGMLAWEQWDCGRAEACYEEALTIRRQLAQPRQIAALLNSLGLLARDSGDFPRAISLYEESIAISRELDDVQGVALAECNLGDAIRLHGDPKRALPHLERGLTLFGELGHQWGMAIAQTFLGAAHCDLGSYSSAERHLEQGLALRRRLDERWGIGDSLIRLGYTVQQRGDLARAESLLRESLAIWQELGDKRSMGSAHLGLGNVALAQGDHGRARAQYEESLALARELGHKSVMAASLGNLGIVALEQGDYPTARALLEECLAVLSELGHKRQIAEGLEGLAELAAAQDQAGRAAVLCGAAEALRETISVPLQPSERARYERSRSSACAALGEVKFAAAWAVGRSLALEEAIALALEPSETIMS